MCPLPQTLEFSGPISHCTLLTTCCRSQYFQRKTMEYRKLDSLHSLRQLWNQNSILVYTKCHGLKIALEIIMQLWM